MKSFKKYNITYFVDTEKAVKGEEPYSDIYDSLDDYVIAEDPIEAIIYALDYLSESAINNGYETDLDYSKFELKIYNEEGKLAELFHKFSACEQDE